MESLREALLLSPTNAVALARFARATLRQSEQENPRRAGEAEFYIRRAVALAPQDREVLAWRDEVLRLPGKP